VDKPEFFQLPVEIETAVSGQCPPLPVFADHFDGLGLHGNKGQCSGERGIFRS